MALPSRCRPGMLVIGPLPASLAEPLSAPAATPTFSKGPFSASLP
uniref:Uncharacterized protein n=1 Tax=Arundo donax TaxID=35708 RepID=A0A0A8YVV6_ARUDO